MSAIIKERLELPSFYKKYCNSATAFDFGGSLVKVAYIQRCPGQLETDGNFVIQMESYCNNVTAEAIGVLDNEGIGTEGNYKVCVTGVRFGFIEKEFMEKMKGRKLDFGFEFSANKSSLHFLSCVLPIHMAFYRFDDGTLDTIKSTESDIHQSYKKLNKGQEETYDMSGSLSASAELFNKKLDQARQLCMHNQENHGWSFYDVYADMYPFMVSQLGSACTFQVMRSRGDLQVMDINPRSGPTIFGIGSLLTGAKTYEELIGLAEKGSHQNLDALIGDVIEGLPADHIYSSSPGNVVAYAFQKAQGKNIGDFSREDLAAGVVSLIVHDIAQCTIAYAAAHKAKYVFIGGSLASHSLIRHELTKAFSVRRCYNTGFDVSIFFLRYGGYLGTLGSVMKTT